MKSRPFVSLLPLMFAAFLASGCNETPQQPEQTAAVPCRCNAPVPPNLIATTAAPAVRHFRHRHVHRAVSYASSTWSETWSENEHSSSTVEYGYSASSGHEAHDDAQSVRAGYRIWIDGYGRRHCVRVARGDDNWQRASDDATRLDPWHGYNNGDDNGY